MAGSGVVVEVTCAASEYRLEMDRGIPSPNCLSKQ